MRGESGYTIVEALLVFALLAVVMGATLGLLDTSAKILPKERERAEAIRESQVGLARITRELRQASQVLAPPFAAPQASTSHTLVVKTKVNGTLTTVTYHCTDPSPTLPGARACRRGQQILIDRVLNWETVFTRTADNYLIVRVEVPASGERTLGHKHRVILDDGVFMRNVATP